MTGRIGYSSLALIPQTFCLLRFLLWFMQRTCETRAVTEKMEEQPDYEEYKKKFSECNYEHFRSIIAKYRPVEATVENAIKCDDTIDPVLLYRDNIPFGTTVENLFDEGRGFEHVAYCAECDRGLIGDIQPEMKALPGEKPPRMIEVRDVEEEEEEEEDDVQDDYEEACENFSHDQNNQYHHHSSDRKMRIKVYVGDKGHATDFTMAGEYSTENFCHYADLLQQRLEKEKQEKLRKTRERLNKVLLSDDYVFMKEHNLF